MGWRMEVTFKFEIGQIVRAKVATVLSNESRKHKTENSVFNRPTLANPFIINQRLAVECSGGIQKVYAAKGSCLGYSTDEERVVAHEKEIQFHEHELEPWEA